MRPRSSPFATATALAETLDSCGLKPSLSIRTAWSRDQAVSLVEASEPCSRSVTADGAKHSRPMWRRSRERVGAARPAMTRARRVCRHEIEWACAVMHGRPPLRRRFWRRRRLDWSGHVFGLLSAAHGRWPRWVSRIGFPASRHALRRDDGADCPDLGPDHFAVASIGSLRSLPSIGFDRRKRGVRLADARALGGGRGPDVVGARGEDRPGDPRALGGLRQNRRLHRPAGENAALPGRAALGARTRVAHEGRGAEREQLAQSPIAETMACAVR